MVTPPDEDLSRLRAFPPAPPGPPAPHELPAIALQTMTLAGFGMVNALTAGNHANSRDTGFGSSKATSWAFGRPPPRNARYTTRWITSGCPVIRPVIHHNITSIAKQHRISRH
jgi:hypothetical protein